MGLVVVVVVVGVVGRANAGGEMNEIEKERGGERW